MQHKKLKMRRPLKFACFKEAQDFFDPRPSSIQKTRKTTVRWAKRSGRRAHLRIYRSFLGE